MQNMQPMDGKTYQVEYCNLDATISIYSCVVNKFKKSKINERNVVKTGQKEKR